MPHHTPLIATIVGGLVLAFIFGAIAHRLRLPPLIGYLVAGICAGPFTPGFVADQSLAPELAEIGVILLMFGVGLHFSLKDLLSVKVIAIPGAVVQIAVAALMGMGLAWAMGWPMGGGLIFGLALSVASTVVLLTALQERRLLETGRGKIAIGWLIVEDLAMVLALVLIPALDGLLGAKGSGAGDGNVLMTLAVTIGKVVAFVVFMLVVGKRFIPWLLARIADTGSHELFRLAVLAIGLGVAFGSTVVFGVSFALGAFFAGMILSESELAHRAAEESLPLREAFAVLFFVSVGMLFDPSILLREPLALLVTVLIIVIGKSVAAFLIVRAFGHPRDTALTIAASLAQIGEFSFILASLGVAMHLLPATGKDLILAGAILSILLNPLLFSLLDRYASRLAEAGPLPDELESGDEAWLTAATLSGHTVLVGYGRVGSLVGAELATAGRPFVVIEARADCHQLAECHGVPVLVGNALADDLLVVAGIDRASWLVVAISNAFEAGQIIAQARDLNPALQVVACAHSDAEAAHLTGLGAAHAVVGEQELARGISTLVLMPAH
ncbi:YbaL family putative K(+) efflux transporter [Crenobacter sp. SG2303]|uniref:YbaL family putative K(+) efflux transporter n=1 Tax=Crenobacter oryzisoli TaxID=3056844 RepID=A0ABT7XI18_9NEIS|nr:YbaL family putative K(+) efflux transporter [Crenobacter sp. SG2303]MDN0073416.1 YbaL family putative K(+) efflux transporter [Crenobacter sp. SG2303]